MPAPSLADFRASLQETAPPARLPPALEALWWAHRGDWTAAHALVQSQADADSAWVHAYLHRQENDLGNAAYWYRRAGRPAASGAPQEEWEAIAAALSGDVQRGCAR